MTTTFNTSGAHIATTRTGGRIVYQADGIELIDAIAAFIVFFIVLLWGAIVTSTGDRQPAKALPVRRPAVTTKPQQPCSWRGSGVGRTWAAAYWRGVLELVRGIV